MTGDQILAACDKYLDFLEKNGYSAKKHSDLKGPQTHESLEHAAWMLEQIPWFINNDDHVAKAMRWLCFVQGVLWREGLTTIEEMRNDNR